MSSLESWFTKFASAVGGIHPTEDILGYVESGDLYPVRVAAPVSHPHFHAMDEISRGVEAIIASVELVDQKADKFEAEKESAENEIEDLEEKVEGLQAQIKKYEEGGVAQELKQLKEANALLREEVKRTANKLFDFGEELKRKDQDLLSRFGLDHENE